MIASRRIMESRNRSERVMSQVSVEIPEGMAEGMRLRIGGKGEPGIKVSHTVTHYSNASLQHTTAMRYCITFM